MSDNVGAIQPSGIFQYTPLYNFYNNPDIDNIDMITSNPYSMSGSLFDQMGQMPYSSMGFDPKKSYFENMKDQQRQWNEYYIEQQKINRQNDIEINSPMEAVRETASNLKDKILHDEQDQIMTAYQKFYDSVANAYAGTSTTREELNSRALAMYTQLNGGRTLIQDLREHGHSSFVQGFIQAGSLGFYAKDSVEDNIANITNQEVPIGEKVSQNAGRVAGVATIGAGAYGITKLLSGNTGTIWNYTRRFLGSKAGIAAMIAAAAVAGLTFFKDKICGN